MEKNTDFNRRVISKVAEALKELNNDVVYVGGAVVSLYIDNPAAEDIRPTKDIDISLSIATVNQLENIRVRLTKKGFMQSSQDTVICRFRYDDTLVDVMNTKSIGWAPANPWFAPGFARKETVEIGNHIIYVLPLPYFLASKFEAFESRGAKDPRTSHDFEDIIYVMDNNINIVETIANAPSDVKPYLVDQLKNVSQNRVMQEAIYGNLNFETRGERFSRIIDCIKSIIQGN